MLHTAPAGPPLDARHEVPVAHDPQEGARDVGVRGLPLPRPRPPPGGAVGAVGAAGPLPHRVVPLGPLDGPPQARLQLLPAFLPDRRAADRHPDRERAERDIPLVSPDAPDGRWRRCRFRRARRANRGVIVLLHSVGSSVASWWSEVGWIRRGKEGAKLDPALSTSTLHPPWLLNLHSTGGPQISMSQARWHPALSPTADIWLSIWLGRAASRSLDCSDAWCDGYSIHCDSH